MDCGRLFLLALAAKAPNANVVICPRCASPNHIEYAEAEHQHITIEVPEGWEHERETRARAIYNRVLALTGWREDKVRLWFQLPNPLLGNVSPEFMIMVSDERCKRLEKFIGEAEQLNDELTGEQHGDES